MLILISRWLPNLMCSMRKALNSQNSQPSSPLFNAVWKTLPQLLIVFLFTTSLFISNFISNFFYPYSSCDCIAYEIIKYNQFQISENKPDETLYACFRTNFSFKPILNLDI